MSNTEVLDCVKTALTKGGINTVLALGRLFLRADKNKSGTLSKDELGDCLARIGAKLSGRNLDKLFKLFDTDNTGSISHNEFTRTLVGEMNEFRAGLVTKVFELIDKDHSGLIEVDDLVGVYSASKHPDVIAKKKSEKQILAQFLDMIEMYFSVLVAIPLIH